MEEKEGERETGGPVFSTHCIMLLPRKLNDSVPLLKPGVLSSDGDAHVDSTCANACTRGHLTNQDTLAAEKEMDARLDAMMNDSRIVGAHAGNEFGDSSADGVIGTLRAPSEVLEIVRADAEQLHTSIASTSEIAETLSARIRVLDVSQVRVKEAITRVNAILDRGTCVDGAKASLDAIKAEEGTDNSQPPGNQKILRMLTDACAHVGKYRELDAEYGEVGEDDGPVSGEQRATMDAVRKELEARVRSDFASAASAASAATVDGSGPSGTTAEVAARYARMFPMLGLVDEGLKLYVKFLRGLVNNKAVARMSALTEELAQREKFGDVGGTNFVNVLGQLFVDVADAIDTNLVMLSEEFGADGVAFAIRELQGEVDNRGCQILSRFMESRDVMRIMRDAASESAAMKPHVGGDGVENGSVRQQIEVILDEITLLCKQSEEYNLYIVQRLRDARDAPLSPQSINSIRSSPYQRQVQELASCYTSLEESSMLDSVRRAIAIDEQQDDVGSSLISSMVDDSFYLLQKSATRALNTQNIQCVCATFNHVCNILANEFRRALEQKIRGASSGLLSFNPLDNPAYEGAAGLSASSEGGALSQDARENERLAAERASAVNNAEVSGEYVGKLKSNLEEAAMGLFSSSSDRERIKSCLGDLGDTSSAFRQIALSSLQSLSNGIFSRIRASLEALTSASYVLTETEYADNEMKDPWVQNLLANIDTLVQWLQPLLVTSAFESLVQIIADSIASRLEAVVLTKRFNQLGGLQLDREVRTLVSSFAVMSSKSLRDRFARLAQLSTVVNLESVGEILDYWGENSGSMTWRLTPGEVKKVLSLRVDFQPAEIARLAL